MRPGVTSDTERPTLSSRAVASGKTVLLGRTFDDAYFGAFVMVLLACWSPLKWLPYVAPLAAIIWMGAAAGGRIIWLRLLQWTLGWVVWILAFGTFKADFTWHSAFIALFFSVMVYLCMHALPRPAAARAKSANRSGGSSDAKKKPTPSRNATAALHP